VKAVEHVKVRQHAQLAASLSRHRVGEDLITAMPEQQRSRQMLEQLHTAYQEQWTKLLDMADDIRAFIRANETSLKTKS
jgi:hypothetical protein